MKRIGSFGAMLFYRFSSYLILCLSVLFLTFSHANFVWGQAKTIGTLAGRVTDANSGEDLIGTSVAVAGTTKGAATDVEGKFSLPLEAGTYLIEVRSIGYTGRRFEGVVIKPGEVTLLSVAMQEATLQAEEVVVTGSAARNNEGSLLGDQRASNSISSGISAELMAKTPDRSVAESFRRVSGASVRDGKFAIVRGLNERYNQGLVNGVSIPSTEADRKAFSLDLFPTALIDRITISKTGTPDQPGDFAGGLVKINTLDIPYANSLTVNLSGEVNTITTGKSFFSSTRSKTDWLGFDNGTRALPKGIQGRQESQANPLEQNRARQSREFNHQYTPVKRSASPNQYAQAFLARRGTVFGKGAGMLFGLNYYRTNTYSDFYNFNLIADSGQQGTTRKVTDFDSTRQDRYRTAVSGSVILNFAIKPDARSKISLRNFLVQNGTDNSYLIQSKSLTNQGITENRREGYLYFYEQSTLISSQLSYERAIGTKGAKVDAVVGTNLLRRSTPDLKRLNYTQQRTQNQPFSEKLAFFSSSGDLFNPEQSGKFFSTLTEDSYNGALNFTAPSFSTSTLKHTPKAGFYYLDRGREFSGRNFLYALGGGNGDIPRQGPDTIFAPQNFGANLLYLRETTKTSDFYTADVQLAAGYLMNESSWGTRGSRLIYGVRYERYTQSVKSATENYPAETKTVVQPDWLPSVNLNLALSEKLALRMAWFKTLNRPELRELSAFTFFDPNLNATVFGSPNLDRARITNYDAKLEYYPREGAVFSINPFYKIFDRPIEQVRVVNAFPNFSYSNGYRALNGGVEFEARSSLARTDSSNSVLSRITLFGNLALVRSRIELVKGLAVTERPLQAQSPYTANAGLSYGVLEGLDATFTFNRIGPRIAFVGLDQSQTIWEKPRSILDLSLNYRRGPLTLRFVWGDMLAQDLIQFQVYDRGQRKPNNGGVNKLLSDAPTYQEGQDIPFYRFTYGSTLRITVGYQF